MKASLYILFDPRGIARDEAYTDSVEDALQHAIETYGKGAAVEPACANSRAEAWRHEKRAERWLAQERREQNVKG